MAEVAKPVFFQSFVYFPLEDCGGFFAENGFSTLFLTLLIPDGFGGGDGFCVCCVESLDIIIGSSEVFLFD